MPMQKRGSMVKPRRIGSAAKASFSGSNRVATRGAATMPESSINAGFYARSFGQLAISLSDFSAVAATQPIVQRQSNIPGSLRL
jgi:hypothetical protein